MRIRVGLVDAAAAVLVLVVLALPARSPEVRSVYADARAEDVRALARHQARLAEEPGDGEAAEALAEALLALGQTDWAVRVAGAAAKPGSPTSWRALLAASSAHADRLEVEDATRYAERALEACDRDGAACPAHWRVRLMVYVRQLQRGVESGIDPALEPERFRREISKAFPTATFRGSRPDTTGGDDAPEAGDDPVREGAPDRGE